ncbi:hypothetical protein A3K64_04130, partial [Candidatus Micrarchaeota archaeon RBG_16_36_9]
MDEDSVVRKITSKLKRPVYMVSNFNDDAEILDVRINKNELLLEKIDTANEGIDFPWEADAWMAAYIATAQSMSDIAACGGKMLGVSTSICVPDDVTEKYVLEFSRGIKLSAEKAGTFVLGGDYNSANDLSLSVVSVGKVKKNNLLTRNGASPGDFIGVTGELGRFNAGYFYYHDGFRNQDVYRKMLVQDPRLKEGNVLASSRKVSSCTDIPDGLIRCLKFLTRGAIVYDEKIPLSKEAREIAQKKNMKPYQMASVPAGDLELIFTTSPKNKPEIDDMFKRESSELSWIGRVTEGSSIKVTGPGYEEVAKKIGYV